MTGSEGCVMTAPDPTSTDVLLKVLKAGGVPAVANTSFRWSLPALNDDGTWTAGEWHEITGELVPCVNAFHLCRVVDLPNWIRYGTEIYLAEASRPAVHKKSGTESKVVTRRARLLSRVAFSESTLRGWAADCAEHVLPIFEVKYPEDKRPRQAIEAARAYVRGEISLEALRKARSAASAAAAYAAYAASAAVAAASDAASAAVAAAYALAASAAAVAAAYALAAASDAAYAAASDAASAAVAAAYALAAASDAAYAAASAVASTRKQEREWQARRLAYLLQIPGYTEEGAPL